MQTTTLTKYALLSCSVLILNSHARVDANTDPATTEDFGQYSSNPAQEAQKHLEALGDWDNTVTNLDEALGNFYARTNLSASSDPVQQLLDIDMVVSAEREAKRALDIGNSEAMQAYAYTIAPWLKKPPNTPANDLLAERSTLTSVISSLDKTLNGLNDTVNILY